VAIEDLTDKQALKNFILEVLAGQPKQATLKLMSTGSGVVAFGTSAATWTAAAVTASVTVAHGLGLIPAVVLVAYREPYNTLAVFDVTAKDATNFTYEGRTATGGNATGTQNTYWVALA
jgi:hypothetical protein